jgi:hypothetical protein
MAFIVQTLTLNRLQLGREEMLRPLVFGAQWNIVRIAALVQVQTGAGFLNQAGMPPITLGLATGASGIYNDSTTDVIGGTPGLSWGLNWTWATGSGNYYVSASSGGATGFQKVGSAFTTAINGSSVMYMGALNVPGGAYNNRTIIALDITKSTLTTPSATPYTFTFWSPNTGTLSTDTSVTNFFDRVQQLNAITNCVALGTASLTPAGAMAHDHALIAWNRSSPALDVCAWAAIRFA